MMRNRMYRKVCPCSKTRIVLIVLLSVVFVGGLVEDAAGCVVTEVTLKAKRTGGDWETSVVVGDGDTVTFKAEVEVEEDSDGRPIKCIFDFGDGSADETKWIDTSTSGPTAAGTYSVETTHVFDSALDSYTVEVSAQRWDPDEDEAIDGSDVDDWPSDECIVYVVKVDKVEKRFDWPPDEGPLCVCVNGEVELEAKPDPSSAVYPAGEPHWEVVGPNGTSPSLNPESGSATTTLSGLTVRGHYIVTTRCGDGDADDSITVTAFTVESKTTSPIPHNRDRTKLGLGERVWCWTEPSVSVLWSVDRGSVDPEIGTSTTFTAPKVISNPEVQAGEGIVDCIKEFEVIAPDGMEYGPDDEYAGGYPYTLGEPDNYIGYGRRFPITIQPTTVSFVWLSFRENLFYEPWTWPDDTEDSFPVGTPPQFGVGFDNTSKDNVSCRGRPYDRLIDSDTGEYVAFSFTLSAPLEFNNLWGVWVEFMAAMENKHDFIFSASGECTLRCRADNTQESDPNGPWQDKGEE